MKKILLILSTALITFSAEAQNAIAKIKYEQAEEAFVKNDFASTLVKLDEAQKLLGATNPKILYLRLMAAKGMITSGTYNWDLLAESRKNAAFYIKQYSEMAGIEDKFRQVYEFSEALEKLPSTKEQLEQKKTEEVQQYKEWAKQRSITVSDSLMNVYRVKKCQNLKELLSYNPGALNGLKKFKHPMSWVTLAYSNNSNYTMAGPTDVYFNDKGLFLYACVVQSQTMDTAFAKKVYRSITELYASDLDKEWVEKKEIARSEDGYESGWSIIKSPATGNKGAFTVYYFGFSSGSYVQIHFAPQ